MSKSRFNPKSKESRFNPKEKEGDWSEFEEWGGKSWFKPEGGKNGNSGKRSSVNSNNGSGHDCPNI
jgi:hypothetical protein